MKIKSGFKGERYIIIPYWLISKIKKSQLCKDLYIHSIGHFSNAEYHYIDRPHGVKEHILIYCKSGAGWVKSGNDSYTIKPNQAVIIPAGTPHGYGADKSMPWSIYWIHFKGNKADLIAAMLKSCVLESHPNISRTKNRLTIFEEMYSALHSCMTFENLCYANLCLPHFLATFLFNEPFIENSKAIEYNTKVDALIYFMNENITERLMLKDFASYIGLSASYLHRIFLKETGLSPMECFNRLKIIRACEYLINGTLKIIQISNLLGFTDPYYFSRIFTKIVGISPSVFRAKNDIGLIPGLIDKTPKQK